MKQFLDHFTTLQQMDAGAWIALSAVVTYFGLLVWAGLQLIPAAVQMYAGMAEMRKQNQEQDNG